MAREMRRPGDAFGDCGAVPRPVERTAAAAPARRARSV